MEKKDWAGFLHSSLVFPFAARYSRILAPTSHRSVSVPVAAVIKSNIVPPVVWPLRCMMYRLFQLCQSFPWLAYNSQVNSGPADQRRSETEYPRVSRACCIDKGINHIDFTSRQPRQGPDFSPDAINLDDVMLLTSTVGKYQSSAGPATAAKANSVGKEKVS